MSERRKLKRRHINFYSRVFDRKTGEFLGFLGNITLEGAMVISEQPIQIGEDILIRIDLPEDMYPKSTLSFSARSVWCNPDVDPKFYNTGFQLIALDPEDAAIIDRIVEDFRFRDDE